MARQVTFSEYRQPKKKQEPIDVEKFVKLAKKVKKSFEEEEEYLEQKKRKNLHFTSRRFFQFS